MLLFVRGLHAHPTWRLVAYSWLKSPLPLTLVAATSGISSLKQYLQAEKASRGEQQKDVPDSDFLISVGGQAKLEEELFGDVKEPAATVSDNGRESAKKRARIETPSGEEKQRRAQKRARPAETQSARGRWAKKQLTAVSIFSGAGGMDVGFTRAGFKVLWAA